MLEEFYKNIDACGISSATGKGFPGLEAKFNKGKDEYYEIFYKEVEKRMQQTKLASEVAMSALEDAFK